MRVLVTGAAGFIGSHLVRHLMRRGFTVTALDDFSEGHHQALPPHLEVFEADVRDFNALTRVFGQRHFDAIVHLAALTSASESFEDPQRYFITNLVGTVTLLRAAVDFRVSRFIFASDAAVYGKPRKKIVHESHPCLPVTPYARSKHFVEQMLADYWRGYGLTVMALRVFVVAGAWAEEGVGESHRLERHLIPNLLKVALGQKDAITINGTDYPTDDGTAIRDYVHILDVCEAFEKALQTPCERPVVLNVGSGRGHSVLEVLKVAERVTGKSIPFKKGPRLEHEPARLVGSVDAAAQFLDWHPTRSDITQIVADAWRWQEKHPYGYVEERPRQRRLFGDIILELGFVTQQQLDEALKLQAQQDAKGEHKLLGVVMLEAGMLTPDQLIRALKEMERYVGEEK